MSLSYGIATQNVTATSCAWPVRNRSSLSPKAVLPVHALAYVLFLIRIIGNLPFFGGKPGWEDLAIVVGTVRLSPVVYQLTRSSFLTLRQLDLHDTSYKCFSAE